MRLLVISHNVFSKNTNMGKTLCGYFKSLKPEDLAQLYVHSEAPTSRMCDNYYRMTDKEALVSILTRKAGRAFGKNDIDDTGEQAGSDIGRAEKLYRTVGRKRTPLTYFGRNAIWRLSGWKNKALMKWVDDFAPEAVFFASGDYSFTYRMALEIARSKNIPLFTVCMDDYYINNINKNSWFGRLMHRLFMKQVTRTMEYASRIFVICEKMAVDYSKLFGDKCCVLHTSSSFSEPLQEVKNNHIAYMGNLGWNRSRQLVDLGRALMELNLENKPRAIDVYSSEIREEILRDMIPENGIIYHGEISSDEVKKIMGQSLAVIHTEAFDEESKARVRYSVSTKIADSLVSGTCLLVYGPADVASVDYVKSNEAGFVISDQAQLETELKRFLTDAALRERIIANAQMLAKKNHDASQNENFVMEAIESVGRNNG